MTQSILSDTRSVTSNVLVHVHNNQVTIDLGLHGGKRVVSVEQVADIVDAVSKFGNEVVNAADLAMQWSGVSFPDTCRSLLLGRLTHVGTYENYGDYAKELTVESGDLTPNSDVINYVDWEKYEGSLVNNNVIRRITYNDAVYVFILDY